MIKTQKQIHEDFLKNCAKVNGREYVSESDRLSPVQKREQMMEKLQKIKQDFAQDQKNEILSKQSFSIGNDEASKLIIKLKKLANHMESINSYCANMPSAKRFHV